MFQLLKNNNDSFLKLLLKCNACIVLLCVLLIFFFLAKESIGALSEHGLSFLTDQSWHPLENQFNLVPMLVGTLAASLGALVIAIPVGIFSALFILFYCPESIRALYTRFIELYTGIPSVIFGFWGLMKLVPMINQWQPPGQSLLAGIIILALMIFPIISLSLVASIQSESKKNLRVSESLGLKKSTFIWRVLLPNQMSHLMGSSLLALGRALGETMAVLMVCGNIVQIPDSVFAPVRTLTANIALEMSYAMGAHRSSLFLTGLILLLFVTLLFFTRERVPMRHKWIG